MSLATACLLVVSLSSQASAVTHVGIKSNGAVIRRESVASRIDTEQADVLTCEVKGSPVAEANGIYTLDPAANPPRRWKNYGCYRKIGTNPLRTLYPDSEGNYCLGRDYTYDDIDGGATGNLYDGLKEFPWLNSFLTPPIGWKLGDDRSIGWKPGGVTVTQVEAYTCGTDVSNDCNQEYNNALNNGNLDAFCHRCASEGGAAPLRSRCKKCCSECQAMESPTATTTTTATATQMLIQTLDDTSASSSQSSRSPVQTYQPSNSQVQPPMHKAPVGESLLGMTDKAEEKNKNALVSRLSDAVEAQSKALVVLENEVEELTSREIQFENFEQQRFAALSTPACSKYSKKGHGPLTNKDTCEAACYSAEGLHGGSWKSSGKCECKVKADSSSEWRTICGKSSGLSLSLLASLGMLIMLLRF